MTGCSDLLRALQTRAIADLYLQQHQPMSWHLWPEIPAQGRFMAACFAVFRFVTVQPNFPAVSTMSIRPWHGLASLEEPLCRVSDTRAGAGPAQSGGDATVGPSGNARAAWVAPILLKNRQGPLEPYPIFRGPARGTSGGAEIVIVVSLSEGFRAAIKWIVSPAICAKRIVVLSRQYGASQGCLQ